MLTAPKHHRLKFVCTREEKKPPTRLTQCTRTFSELNIILLLVAMRCGTFWDGIFGIPCLCVENPDVWLWFSMRFHIPPQCDNYFLIIKSKKNIFSLNGGRVLHLPHRHTVFAVPCVICENRYHDYCVFVPVPVVGRDYCFFVFLPWFTGKCKLIILATNAHFSMALASPVVHRNQLHLLAFCRFGMYAACEMFIVQRSTASAR